MYDCPINALCTNPYTMAYLHLQVNVCSISMSSWAGEHVWVKPYSIVTSLKGVEANCGPLSDISASGTLGHAFCPLRLCRGLGDSSFEVLCLFCLLCWLCPLWRIVYSEWACLLLCLPYTTSFVCVVHHTLTTLQNLYLPKAGTGDLPNSSLLKQYGGQEEFCPSPVWWMFLLLTSSVPLVCLEWVMNAWHDMSLPLEPLIQVCQVKVRTFSLAESPFDLFLSWPHHTVDGETGCGADRAHGAAPGFSSILYSAGQRPQDCGITLYDIFSHLDFVLLWLEAPIVVLLACFTKQMFFCHLQFSLGYAFTCKSCLPGP